MSEKSRHGKGAAIAGQSVGGRFATMERTTATSVGLNQPSSDATPVLMSVHEIHPGDVVLVDQQIADTELLPLGSELEVVGTLRDSRGLTLQTNSENGCGIFLEVAPDRQLQIRDPYADIRRPEWDVNRHEYSESSPMDWQGAELGFEDFGVTSVTTQGDPGTGDAALVATLHEDPVSAGCLTEEQFNRGWQHLNRALSEEYGVDVSLAENREGEAGAALSLEFSTRLGGEPTISDDMASDLLWEKTQMVRFHNESDSGTFGSPYIYGRITDEIDNGFFPGMNQHGHLDHDVQGSVKGQAAEVLSSAVPGDHDSSQLDMLVKRGYCTDAGAALAELHAVAPGDCDSDATQRLKKSLSNELEWQHSRNETMEARS